MVIRPYRRGSAQVEMLAYAPALLLVVGLCIAAAKVGLERLRAGGPGLDPGRSAESSTEGASLPERPSGGRSRRSPGSPEAGARDGRFIVSNQVVRLLLPSILGMSGLIGNYWWVHRQVAPAKYVVLKQDVAAGQRIPSGAIEAVEVPGHDGIRERDFIPWSQKETAVEAVAMRGLRAGSLLLMEDVRASRGVPAGFDRVFVPLQGVAFRPDGLLPDASIYFIARTPASDEERTGRDPSGDDREGDMPAGYLRLGPFRVFEPPVLDSNDLDRAERGRASLVMPLSVLVSRNDPERLAPKLYGAVANQLIVAVEVVGDR